MHLCAFGSSFECLGSQLWTRATLPKFFKGMSFINREFGKQSIKKCIGVLKFNVHRVNLLNKYVVVKTACPKDIAVKMGRDWNLRIDATKLYYPLFCIWFLRELVQFLA